MDSKKECAGNSDTFSECTEALVHSTPFSRSGCHALRTTLGMADKLHSPKMTAENAGYQLRIFAKSYSSGFSTKAFAAS